MHLYFTNPSFKEYVKIGYADNVDMRLKQLNNSECIPFAFRIYAAYEVEERLTDLKLHALIDQLNPNLRSIDEVDGKRRVREFYAMPPELRKAHQENDKAVMRAYGFNIKETTESSCVAELMKMYQELVGG